MAALSFTMMRPSSFNFSSGYQKENIFVGKFKFQSASKEHTKDKDAKIVVYCMMGPMGDVAAEELADMGYTRVSNFQGGMMAWTQAGRNLQRRQK